MSTLQFSPADVVSQYLIDQADFTLPSANGSWPVYVSFLPEGTDEVAVIYDTPGVKDGRHMDGENIRHYGVQVAMRSTVYSTLWTKVNGIYEKLEAVKNVSVSMSSSVSIQLQNVSAIAPPVNVGVEPGTKRRQMFTINYLVTLKEE